MTKKIIIGLVVFSILSKISSGQEIPDTLFGRPELLNLKDEVKMELTGNILHFWATKMRDTVNGGFWGRMDLKNNIYPDAHKGGILNARILWTFSAAYRVLKDTNYLIMANLTRDYILKYFIDREYGGTLRSVNAIGNPSDTRKQTYSQAFFIYALSEYFRITNDSIALNEAVSIYKFVEQYCSDSKNNGYFEVFSRSWNKIDDLLIGEKSVADQKSMNTHLHLLEAYTNLYRVWPDKILKTRLQNLIELFLNKIIDAQVWHLIVFMTDTWERTSSSFSYGHDIESSWLLWEAAHVLGNAEIIKKVGFVSLKIANATVEGIEPDGSLIYEKDFKSMHKNTERQWWPQAEAIVGFAYAYRISGKLEYLHKSVKCWEYTRKYIVDRKNGEWYPVVYETGLPSEKGDRAGFWKCPYHNGRMCLEIIEMANH